MKTAHQIEDRQDEKAVVGNRTQGTDGAEKARIETLHHQWSVDDGKPEKGDRGDSRDQEYGRIVQGEHRPEQDVQQVDIASTRRDDHDPDGEGNQIEGGQAGILTGHGGSGRHPGEQSHSHSRNDPADRHGAKRQPCNEVPERRTGKNCMGHGIPGKTHPPQGQKHPDGRRSQRKSEAPDQGPTHEAEFNERGDDGIVHHASLAAGQVALAFISNIRPPLR